MPADGLFDFFSGGDFAQPPASAPAFDPSSVSGGGDAGPIDLSKPITETDSPFAASFPKIPGADGGAGGFDYAKYLPALVSGGAGLIGYLRGQGGETDKAIKELHGTTGPMQSAGNQALNAYTSGNLTPAQQAAVDQYRKQAMAKWQQYMASAGIPVSSAQADIENKVNMDTMAYANQLLQQDFQNAYAATGMTATNLTNVARMQALQDQEQRAQWAEFMKEIGKLGGDIFGQGGIMS